MLRNAVYITVFPSVLYALLHWLGYRWPVHLWGVDLFHYYPPYYLVLFLALAAVLAGLALTRQCLRAAVLARRLARRAELKGTLGVVLRWGGMLLFFLLAYVLRVREHALGDSALRFSELEEFRVLAGDLFGPFAIFARILAEGNLRFESLDFAIHLLAYAIGFKYLNWTPEHAYAGLSMLAGGAYVLALWRLGAQLGETALERFSYFAAGCTLGIMQLFFGYGESYTLVTACAAFYLLLALRCIRGGSLLWPVLCLATCALLHAISLSLVLSLFYLVWLKIGRPGLRYLARREATFVLWPLALVVGLWLYDRFYPIAMPLWVPAEEGQYALFSSGHALLLANTALLVSPFGLLWGLVAWARRSWGNSEDVLLAWAAWGTMGLIFFHNAFLGGRDWDLLSFPGLFCALWGVRSLLRLARKPRTLALLWTAVLPLMLLHTGAWIVLNTDAQRVHQRSVNLLQFSNQSTHYRHYTMGYYYFLRPDKTEQAIRHFRKAVDTLPPENEFYELNASRYEKWLGRMLVEDEEYAEAQVVLERAFARKGEIVDKEQEVPFMNSLIVAYLKLCLRDLKAGHVDRAGEHLERVLVYCHRSLAVSDDAYTYLYLGYAMDMQNRPAEAAAAFYQSVQRLTERSAIIDTYSHLAYSLEKMGELNLALSALEEGAVRVSSAELYEALAELYARSGALDKAKSARTAAAAVRADY